MLTLVLEIVSLWMMEGKLLTLQHMQVDTLSGLRDNHIIHHEINR